MWLWQPAHFVQSAVPNWFVLSAGRHESAHEREQFCQPTDQPVDQKPSSMRILYTFVGCGNKSRPKVKVHARLTFDCDTSECVAAGRPDHRHNSAVGNNWRCSTALITAHLQAAVRETNFRLSCVSLAPWFFSANAPGVLIALVLIKSGVRVKGAAKTRRVGDRRRKTAKRWVVCLLSADAVKNCEKQ